MDDSAAIHLLEIVFTGLFTFLASSGFWVFMEKRRGLKGSSRRLLMGLAHSRIVSLSLRYIHRGWISQDEHENLCSYLYQPFMEMGGNGATKRLMVEIDKLPIKAYSLIKKGEDDDVPE